MDINEDNILDIQIHAVDSFPNECVGVLVDGVYHKLKNTHPQPTTSFRVDPAEYEATIVNGDQIILVHSHPYDDKPHKRFDMRTPSKSDMATAQAMAVPFAIVATDGESCSQPLIFNTNETVELLKREFIHGVYDCWTAVRDYYKQNHNVDLPNPPRQFNWWYDEPEAEFYSQLDDNGFVEVDIDDIQVDDVVLFSLDTEVINHAAVYIDMDKIYHHLFGRLSCRESMHRYSDQITKIMRYTGERSTNNTDG